MGKCAREIFLRREKERKDRGKGTGREGRYITPKIRDRDNIIGDNYT